MVGLDSSFILIGKRTVKIFVARICLVEFWQVDELLRVDDDGPLAIS